MSDDKIKSSTSYLVVVGPGGQATIHTPMAEFTS